VDRFLKQALQNAPNSAEVIKLQVAYLATDSRLGEAAALLETATGKKEQSQNADLWALRAEVLRRLGQSDEAMKVLDQATALLGEQASLRIARAQVLSAQGNEKGAYDALAEGARLVPPDQRAGLWKALGDLHRRLNDPSGARTAYAEWARLAPQDPQPTLQILELALAANDESAVQAAVAAARKFGGLAKPLAETLVLLKVQPDQDEKARNAQLKTAQQKIDGIVKEHPTKPIGYLLRGQLYELQERIPEAIDAYQAARDHNGGPQALRSLFLLLARHKDFERLNRLRKDLTSDEQSPELEQIAADIALAAGDKKTAEEFLKEVVKLDPQSLNTYLFKARTLARMGKPREAEETFQILIQQRPTELAPRVGLLYLQVSQKQFDQAAATVEQIRSQVKIDRPEFVWAGCYWTIGNLLKATEYYEAARSPTS
jgi:predicted Zn-dependent protease